MALEELYKIEHNGDIYTIMNLGPAFDIMIRRRPGLRICPFCKQPITVESGNLILVTSTSDMPNKIVHAECFMKQSPLEGVHDLSEDWTAAQDYAHWFE